MKGVAIAPAQVGPASRIAPRAGHESPEALGAAIRLFWTHGSPRILAFLSVASAASRARAGGPSWADVAVVGGLLAFWPIQEWLIHVFLLHFRPRRVMGFTLDPALSRKHREHHRDPYRIPLLFIPVRTYLYAPILVVGLWMSLMPTRGLAWTAIATHFLLSLHYEWVHFIVHTRYVPRTWLYRRLWRNHRLHHFKNEQYWHGVTMLAGDRLMGTSPEPEQVPTSPLCFALPSAP